MYGSILITWIIKVHYFPLFSLELPSSNFSTATTHLHFLNIYSTMAKKIHNNGHTKHLGNYDWIHFNHKRTK
jgi:hypothetical protein